MRPHAGKRDLDYLALCLFGAQAFSTCGKRQYFAVIIGADGRVDSTGYNGSPPGMRHCMDGACPRLAEGSPSGTSYDNCISNHAEINALAYSDRTTRAGGMLFVNGTPCFTCAKAISGSGLSYLGYIEDPSYAQWPDIAKFLYSTGVNLSGYSKKDCIDRFNEIYSRVLGT